MDIKKAIRYTKEAIKIAKSYEELVLCENAVMRIEKELQRKETGDVYFTTPKSIFRTYEAKNPANKKLKRLVRD